jgi:molybdopterin/thiamine biosynthesis adenylyltransferase
MNRITIPDVLANVAELPGRTYVVTGITVAQRLEALCDLHPKLRPHLFHANGTIKDHFLLVAGGRVVMPTTALAPDDEMIIMLATSGGTGCGSAMITNAERDRYARHIMLPQVGEQGQIKLKNSRVLIVGTGGLGSPIAMYLAAAGVGVIGLADFDRVDESNLQRQIVHGVNTVGIQKVLSAQRRLKEINDFVIVEPHDITLTSDNAAGLIARYDVVVDDCDNFETRYILNAACRLANKPYVYGSIFQFDGQISVFLPERGPCYQCLYPEMTPSVAAPNYQNKGVLGVLPGIVGILEATETLKILLNIGKIMAGRLLICDALAMTFHEIAFDPRPDCPICGSTSMVSNRHATA